VRFQQHQQQTIRSQFDSNSNTSLQNQQTTSTSVNTNTAATQSRQIIIPPTLKKTINKIDQQIHEDQEIFNPNNGGINLNSEAARKLLLIERNKSLSRNNSRHNSLSGANNNNGPAITLMNLNHSGSMPPSQQRPFYPNSNYNRHHVHTQQRSYSSCGEPVHHYYGNGYGPSSQSPINNHGGYVETRRCLSNRASPIRQVAAHPPPAYMTSNSSKLISENLKESMRRSRSANRRTKSKSPLQSYTPVEQYFKREIKINLAQPINKPNKNEVEEEQQHMIDQLDEIETKTITTTSVVKPPTPTIEKKTIVTTVHHHHHISAPQTPEVQEEVLLNLFSCTGSGSISGSESSESLVEFDEDQHKLKINEVYEKQQQQENAKVEVKRNNIQHQLMLEKRMAELEKKLQKLPELEIKNNILLEEKQILIKQLLNAKQTQPIPQPKVAEPAKVIFKAYFYINSITFYNPSVKKHSANVINLYRITFI
jgi:hypothetical protein